MKIHFVLTFCLLLSVVTSLAQRTSYLSFSAGISAPTGQFAERGYSNSDAANAETGVTLNLRYARTVGESKFGYAFSLIKSSYKYNTESIKQSYGGQWSASSYKLVGFLPGFFFSSNLNDKLAIDCHVMLGLSIMSYPDINGAAPEIFFISAEAVSGFSFDSGVGLRYNAGKRIGLFLNTALFQSNAKFDVERKASGGGFVSYTKTVSIQYRSIDVSGGIAYRFR